MIDLLGVQDKTRGAHAPWSCGQIEKHHSIVDKTLEALVRDFPNFSKRTLLQWATMVKNCTATSTGWSPFQFVFGRYPKLPSVLDSKNAAMREDIMLKTMLENMTALEESRIKYNAALADARLKKMIKSQVRTNQTIFQRGDNIYWKDLVSIENWRQGKVLAVDGKLLFVRTGGSLYRVTSNMAVKKGKEFGE